VLEAREKVEYETGMSCNLVAVRPELYTELCIEIGEDEIREIDSVVVAVSDALEEDFKFFVDPYEI
jgi:hypothetical protein